MLDGGVGTAAPASRPPATGRPVEGARGTWLAAVQLAAGRLVSGGQQEPNHGVDSQTARPRDMQGSEPGDLRGRDPAVKSVYGCEYSAICAKSQPMGCRLFVAFCYSPRVPYGARVAVVAEVDGHVGRVMAGQAPFPDPVGPPGPGPRPG